MLGIIEIILFICGIIGLITGKLPSFVFGKKYRIEGSGARLISVLLVLPLPVSFCVGLVASLLMGDQVLGFITVFEIVVLVVCFVAAAMISRRVRQPADVSLQTSGISSGDHRTS
jgi:hypothetical protein